MINSNGYAAENATKCDENTGAIGAEDSSNFSKFQALDAKGEYVALQDLLILWYPQRHKDYDDAYFFKCESQPWAGLHLNEQLLVPAGCDPDVLYTWGGHSKLNFIEQAYGSDNSWLVEFDFSNFQVVESWSYGTPEHYDEIVRDIQRISSGARALGYLAAEPAGSGINRVYNAGIGEFGQQDEATLKRNLLSMVHMILNHQGHIYFNHGVCKNRKAHFETERPTYFNQ